MALNFPDSPTLNQIYTDATSGFSYQWDGVVWQSYTPFATKNILVLDDISGSFDGLTTNFNLTDSGTAVTPTNSQQLRVTLGGIVQEPGTDYLVASSTIIFTTAPGSGLDCSIVSLGPAVASDAPNSGNIFARQEYNPTGIQTTFTFTSTYTPGYFEVYRNGVKLVDGNDFTATDGSTFDLTTPAQNGDVVEAITYLQTTLYTLGAYATDLIVTGNATVAGITTLTTAVIGTATTFTEDLVVNGDARVTGILTVGTSSITLDGDSNEIRVGSGVTISSSTGLSGSGANLTSLNASNLSSGTVATARLGSGSASSANFLRGDQTWAEAGGGAWEFISSITASNSAQVAFTSGIDSTYDVYVIIHSNVKSSNPNVKLSSQWSSDGGSTWLTSYLYSGYVVTESISYNKALTGTLFPFPTDQLSKTSNNEGIYHLFHPSTSSRVTARWIGSNHNIGAENYPSQGSLWARSNSDVIVNAIRFYFTADNIASGTFRLYGIKNS